MGPTRRARKAMLVSLVLAVTMAGAVVTLFHYESDSAFVYAQQHPTGFTARRLEALLLPTREPVATGQGSRAIQVRCRAGTDGPKLNPWRCVIRYRSDDDPVDYRITVRPDGSFTGADPTGRRTVEGCCLVGTAVS